MSRVILRAIAIATTALAVTVSGVALVAARQVSAEPVFTAKQATTGKAAYTKECASCHLPDLSGENEIPALAGQAFKAMWATRSTKELLDYMSEAMPYGRPSLTADAYTSILAYILESNGAVAGERELTASTAVEIASLTPARATPTPHE